MKQPDEVRATTEAITAKLSPLSQAERLWARLTPCDGLCRLCGGSGHLMCFQADEREFWDCPACGGLGARAVFSKPEIRTHAR